MPKSCTHRWLSVRLETLGAMAALAAAVLTVEQRGNASTFGLVLSYALSITMLTSMTVSLLLNAYTWEVQHVRAMSRSLCFYTFCLEIQPSERSTEKGVWLP